MRKTFVGFLVFAGFAVAQPVGFGLKMGAPLNDALNAGTTTTLQYVENTTRFVVGPYVEVRLPFKISIEVDALHRSYDYQLFVAGASQPKVNVSSWEFPVLAKYKLLPGPIKPYIEGGVSFSHLAGIADVLELNHRTNTGVVLGAGIELKVLHLRISPEVRYEGWTVKNFESPSSLLQSNRNQASFLVGIGF